MEQHENFPIPRRIPMPLSQQLQHLHYQQPQPPIPVQIGFAPRRLYDNLAGSGSACLGNGSSIKGPPIMQRPIKAKMEKATLDQISQQAGLSGQLQLTDPGADGGAGFLPADEALRFVSETVSNLVALKTPVSILQENASPSSSAGPSASVTGLGAGCGSGGSDGNANAAGGGDDKIVGNPIGWLQEMCLQRRWPPPSYETETEVGLPHERLFTIACSILNYREMGQGKSKKIAKRLAAHRMWMRLQGAPIDSAKISDTICSTMSDHYDRVTLDFELLKL